MSFMRKVILLLVLIVILTGCFKDNLKQAKIIDGNWKVTEHRFVFYNYGNPRQVSLDTTIYNSGTFSFVRIDNQSGTFTFTPVQSNLVILDMNYFARDGKWEIHHSPTYNTMYLYYGTHDVPDIIIQIADFEKKEQTWYINKDVGNFTNAYDITEILKVKKN